MFCAVRGTELCEDAFPPGLVLRSLFAYSVSSGLVSLVLDAFLVREHEDPNH